MDWFWTWGGECFGYRIDDGLFTHDGREVGRFSEKEIYGPDGRYLGEVMNDNRLITCLGKRNWVSGRFAPRSGGSYVRFVGYVGYVMYAGYEDFPGPDSFR